MTPIGLDERKGIQIEILDAVDLFCQEKGIRYSLACGTLLGAVRHGGYIPWDDDIDICMLRKDFEKFEQEFPNALEGKYEFASLKRREDWCLCFGKVFDNRTLVNERKREFPPIGINIDVFAYDDIPDDETEWQAFNAKRRKLQKDIDLSRIKFSKDYPLWKNVAVVFTKMRYGFISTRQRAQKMDASIRKYNNMGFHRVFETTAGMFCKQPFEKTLFDEMESIAFENKSYQAFKDYASYLKATYGHDYMTPPPVEKRVSLHTSDAFWK